MKRKLTKKEISSINIRYIRGHDKWHRMYTGESSNLLKYVNGIIYLEYNRPKNSRQVGDYARILYFVKSWKEWNEELKNATGFAVYCYTTDTPAGFNFTNTQVIRDDEIKFKEQLKKAIAKITRKSYRILDRVYKGSFTEDSS